MHYIAHAVHEPEGTKRHKISKNAGFDYIIVGVK